MEKNINVVVPEGYDVTPININILEGATPNPINMKPVHVSGAIESVKNWVGTRTFPKESAYITMDPEKQQIELVINEGHPNATVITATMQPNPELSKFGINADRRYSPSSLASLIKLNRAYFTDNDAHAKFLMNLKKHSAQIERKIEEVSDDRGNGGKSDFTKLTTDIDERFTLNMPLFKGGEKKTFEVYVCMEVRDKGISIWLESVELKELETLITEQEFADQERQFTDKGFTVIIK